MIPQEQVLSQKQELFLTALKEVGTIRRAVVVAKTGRSTVDRWRKDNVNGFRARFDEAMSDFADMLEAKMFDLIGEMKVGHNPTLLIFALKALRPLKYRELTQIPDENARDLLRKLEEFTATAPATAGIAEDRPENMLTAVEQVERLFRANNVKSADDTPNG